MRRICVIDNSTLVNLTKIHHLGVFRQLRYIFDTIHIPLMVKAEYESEVALRYEPERNKLINQMRVNEGFLAICSRYETISLQFLKTTQGIDQGEAEAAAQHIFLNSNYILSDDSKFTVSVQQLYPHIKIISTLHLIAWLDFMKMIDKPSILFLTLFNHWKFKRPELQRAYREVGKELGIAISKKELNTKTLFSTLGIPSS